MYRLTADGLLLTRRFHYYFLGFPDYYHGRDNPLFIGLDESYTLFLCSFLFSQVGGLMSHHMRISDSIVSSAAVAVRSLVVSTPLHTLISSSNKLDRGRLCRCSLCLFSFAQYCTSVSPLQAIKFPGHPNHSSHSTLPYSLLLLNALSPKSPR